MLMSLTVLVAMVLFVLQQSILLMLLQSYNVFWFLSLIWAVPTLLYMIFAAFRETHLAESVSAAWLLYALGLAGEFGGMHFTFVWEYGVSAAVDVALLMTPVIAAFLTIASKNALHMFDTEEKDISVTGLLYTGLMNFVTLDLLDLMAVISSVSRTTAVMLPDHFWAYVFIGVIIVLATATLAFAFSASAGALNVRKCDLFVTAKHVALMGTFIIDIPLLFFRLYQTIALLHYFPTTELFMYKNVICIFLRALHLHECRLAERQHAKQPQDYTPSSTPSNSSSSSTFASSSYGGSTLLSSSSSSSSVALLQGSSFVGGPAAQEDYHYHHHYHHHHMQQSQELLGAFFAAAIPATLGPAAGGTDRGGFADGSRERSAIGSTLHYYHHHGIQQNPQSYSGLVGRGGSSTSVANISGVYPVSSPPMPLLRRHCVSSESSRLKRLIGILEEVRQVPVSGFGFRRVLAAFVHSLLFAYKRSFAAFLDDELTASYWRRGRLILPLLVFWTGLISLIVQLWYAATHSHRCVDYCVFCSFFHDARPSPSGDDLLTLVIACATSVLVFLCFLTTSPWFEVLFVSAGSLVRVIAYAQIYRSVCCSISNSAAAANSNVTPASSGSLTSILVFTALLLHPATAVVFAVKAILCALLGRHQVYWFRASRLRDQRYQYFVQEANTTFAHQKVASTTAALVFLCCRNQLAPLSLNKLLMCSDIVKNLRLQEGLSHTQWRDVVIAGLLHVWVMSVHFSYLALAIAVLHLVFLLMYVTLSQAILLIALRKYEVRRLFAVVAAQRLRDPLDERQLTCTWSFKFIEKPNYITLLQTDKPVLYHGFYSSPGTVLPSFL